MSNPINLNPNVDYIPPATGREVALRTEFRTRLGELHAEAENETTAILQTMEQRNKILSAAKAEAKRITAETKTELKEMGLVK
jgi:hypothetical protein